jgi:hypothetical protein
MANAFDFEQAVARGGNRPSLLRTAEELIGQQERLLDDIRKALRAGSLGALARPYADLQGMLAALGAERCETTLHGVDRAARDRQWQDAQSSCTSLQLELSTLVRQLRAVLQTGARQA